jgi:hypothetical protein
MSVPNGEPKNTPGDKPDGLDIDDDEAQRLLADAVDDGAEDDDDPEGADKLGDAGKRALEAIKEQRKNARMERDRYKTELEEMRAKLAKHEDKDKTEAQRLQEAADSFKSRAEKAEALHKRREIAEETAPDHATVAQIRAVAKRLSGESDDELEADAKELFALIAPEPSGGGTPPKNTPPSKPKASLRGGGDPDSGDSETDPAKLAALIPRNR